MRSVAAGVAIACGLVAACQPQDTSSDGTDGPYDGGAVPYHPTDAGSFSVSCHADPDCGSGLVCARDGECLPASAVRAVRVQWTVQGAAATTTSCAEYPRLAVIFEATDPADSVGFAPVPCPAGIFSVDKLPRRFIRVIATSESSSASASGDIDATGTVLLDLP